MIDTIQGPPRWAGPDVLLRQTSFRALAEPRRFRDSEGTVTEGSLRVRFGEVEARGVALTARAGSATTPRWPQPDPAASGGEHFPATDAELAADGLAYYRGGDPHQTRGLRRLPTRFGGGHLPLQPRLATPPTVDARDESDYSLDWMAGAIGHHIHDPYDLYEKAAR